ncbi:uncharacterized protein LOC133784904 [Humulus lupulus]|uniref:uncharacterized protein LOC133784904 n=1 Tax=Humulus lupulus TaxID=3486 RepID=UPI002B406B41|nr:uncharacterized protein LOC133784904 [Humulus lupulus]
MVSQPPAIIGLPVVENRMEPLFERFQKQHPPVFEGNIDPVQAEEWISGMERILNMMGVQGNERVVFNDKYYKSAVLTAKMDEFTKLTQGNLSVTEYAQKFDRLEKFAKGLVPTDKWWKWLLRQKEAKKESGKIMLLEGMPRRVGATTSNDNRKRGQDQPSQARNDKKPKPNNDNLPGGNGGRNIPTCPKCTKRHFGECRAGVCYKCGKEGHVKRNCPTWEQSSNKE